MCPLVLPCTCLFQKRACALIYYLYKKNVATVLLIDDEEKLRSLLCRIIKLEGFTVYEAATLHRIYHHIPAVP